MLSKTVDRPMHTQPLCEKSAVLALQSFSQALTQVGYGESTIATHLRSAKHFVDWTERKGVRLCDLSDARQVSPRRARQHVPATREPVL